MDARVAAAGREYDVVFDWPARRLAFVTGALSDDAEGGGIAAFARLRCDEELLGMALSERTYALTGDAQVALLDRSVAHVVSVQATAPGYRPLQASITVPAFAPLPVEQDLALRGLPTNARGRVLGKSSGPNPEFLPVAGARLTLTGPTGPGGELPLLLAQPLGRDLVAGAALRARSVTPQPAVTALEPAVPGDTHVALVDGGGVGPGTLLYVGAPGRGFWAEVARTFAHPDRPAPASWAWLTEPLSGSVAAGAVIATFAKAGFVGAAVTPVGEGYAGECVLWVDALPGAGDVLVLSQPGHPDRHHDRDVITGPSGDYLINGFARMGVAELQVSAVGLLTQTRSLPARRIVSGPLDWLLLP